jgi:CheY-like chemotaxis protein
LARKILLADDSVTAQNMGRKILSDAGYEVVTVNNGSAALKKIAEHKPDLIVLDVYMPGYSGLEVCQRIKENKETSRIPILLTVGKLEPFKPEEARRARADAFVVKPFEASELLTALTRLEDKIVPQAEPYKQGRFAKAMAAVDTDNTTGEQFGDAEGGWKARLRIPTGSHKSRDAEPDVDYAATQGKGIRDLEIDDADKKRKSKTAEPAQFERQIPAGLPADITPEEIAAITAAAAHLNGALPVASAAPEVPTISPEPAVPEAISNAEENAASPVSNEPSAVDEPVTFASSPELRVAEPEASVTQAQSQNEQVEAATDPANSVEVAQLVATASDEPEGDTAVTAATAVEPPDRPKAEETFQVVQAGYEPPSADALPAPEVAVQVAPEEMAAAEGPACVEGTTPEDVSTNASAPVEVETAQSVMRQASQAPPPPADDEFMTALQNLMPAKDNESSSPASKEKEEDMPPALAAIVAEVDSQMLVAHSSGPRWIAEEVVLAASEASLCLQREMEQAYAAFAAADGFRATAHHVVEHTASVVAVVEASSGPPAPVEMPEISEPPAVLAMAAAAADSGRALAGAPVAEEVPTSPTDSIHNQQEIHQETSRTNVAPEMSQPHEPQARAHDDAAVVDSQGMTAAPTENDIVGGTEDMAANWKNIRDSIAGSAAKPAVAKEEIRDVEPAQPEGEPVATENMSSSGAADPRAIANIVDSVLAELRPKIVEEIARKLADPKKS